MKFKRTRGLWLIALLGGLTATSAVCAIRYHDQVTHQLSAAEIELRHATEHAELLFQTLRLATDQLAADISKYGIASEIRDPFAEFDEAAPVLRNLIVADSKGTVRAELGGEPVGVGLDVSDREYFSAHPHASAPRPVDFFLGDPIESRRDGSQLVPFSRAIRSPDGSLVAVIAAGIDAMFLESIRHGSKLDLGMRYYLLTAKRALPIDPVSDGAEPTHNISGLGLYDRLAASEEGPTVSVRHAGYAYFTGMIPHWNLGIAVERPLSAIRADALRATAVPALIGILATFIAAAGVRLYSNAYEKLRDKQKDAEHIAERLRLATDAGQIGIWEYDLETGALYWDQAIMDLYQIRRTDFGGRFEDWAGRIHPEDVASARGLFERTLKTGELYDTEFRIMTRSGNVRYVKAYGSAVKNAAGETVRVTGVNYNLTKLRTAEVAAKQNQRRFQDMAENIPGAIYQYDILPDGTDQIVYLGPGCTDIWELSWEDIKGDPSRLWQMIDPDDLPAMQASVVKSAETLSPWDHKWRVQLESGRRKHLHGRGKPVLMENGTIRFNSLVLDVTEQENRKREIEQARKAAEISHHRLENAIEALQDAFVVFDSDERMVICNSRYREYFAEMPQLLEAGISFEHLTRALVEKGQRPDAAGQEEEWLAKRLDRFRDPAAPFEMAMPGDRFVEVHESRTGNGDTVSLRIDVTEARRQTRRLEQMAADLERAREQAVHDSLHDALTGLPNRRYLEQYLYKKVTAAKSDDHLASLHVDIDRFKHINDTLGYSVGDKVLRHVAAVLTDLAPKDAFLARTGGDEFVLLCRMPEDIDGLCRRILQRLSTPVEIDRQTCRFSASIGTAMRPAAEAHSILSNADIALYKAKDTGRNRVEVFTSKLQSELTERKRIADDILHGLERDEFVAHYQPQFDAKTRAYAGLEALVRWAHPTRGLLPPAEFFDVAEDLNVMGDLDRRVLKQSVEVCRRLEADGVKTPKISVNIGFARISDPDLMDELARMDPCNSQIAFELLETIFLDEQTDEIAQNIDRIRDSGITIELDDFGSGRASMVSLLKLQPDCIKIDRQLIQPIIKRGEQLDLVRAIVDMARARGIRITAEGVETSEHARILTELGCDTLQGYAFARPMPAEDLAAFLKSEAWRKAA
ncbi:MAG: EAL domain-containing protein [Roseibium sp.]|nr:EAL domain-containing protein [Roseibium sp.]